MRVIAQKLFNAIKSRHSWRKATFKDMSALYIAHITRLTALRLSSVFIPAYLFNNGYPLIDILYLLLGYYLIRAISSIILGLFISRIGSKKVLLFSNLCQVPSLVLFSFIDSEFGFIFIVIGLILQAIAENLYSTSYNIIFSEIKNNKNSTKEIGFMMIFARISGVVTPLIGGLLMTYFNPNVTLITSSILLMIASYPLFKTKNLSKSGHYFNLKGFPWRAYKANFLTQIGRSFNNVTGVLWLVFIAAFLSNNSYGVIGIAASIDSVAGLFLIYFLTKFTNNNNKNIQRRLFLLSVFLHSLSMIFRFFISSEIGVAIFGVAFGLTHAFNIMMNSKAQYDAADKSGSRVVYESARHFAWNIFSFLNIVVIIILMKLLNNPELSFRVLFIISSIMFLITTLSDYPMHRKKDL